jgi:site-specific DNA recombinase
MKKIAIYCRVSSDDQKERDTIENQVEILRTYTEMKSELQIYKEYLDNGISGTIPFEQRPGGKDLIEDAARHLFDIVLVWKIDRFGRDTLSGLNAIELLRKYDVEILSVTEPFDLNTPTGRFQFITYLNMAELERNNILDRMFLGATRAAKQGKWLGGIVPYGYFVNKDGFLEINKEEASIIKKIYDLYTNENMSTMNIALYLNSTGITSSCGNGKGKRTKNISGMWRSSSIQRILNSTTYKGVHEYGKRGSRRKESILRNVPAIISEEQWNFAQIKK